MAFEWSSFCRCETGNVRRVNEDAYLDTKDKGIWVVADGMGGHQSGDLASRSIVQSLAHSKTFTVLSKTVDEIVERLKKVNTELYQAALQRGTNQTIGSTVVVMVAHENSCAFIWAGDSRLYRYRDGVLSRLTQDHSHVQEIIDMGMLLPEDAENHPAANMILRAVGAAEDIQLDSEYTTMQACDVYLLCSDGLYKELNEDEIGSILAQSDSKTACNSLVDLALQRQCQDNVTAIVIDFASDEKTVLRRDSASEKLPPDITLLR